MELLRAFVPGVSVKKQLLIQTFVSNFDDGHSLTYIYNNSGAISDADTTMAKNANAASTTCHAPHCAPQYQTNSMRSAAEPRAAVHRAGWLAGPVVPAAEVLERDQVPRPLPQRLDRKGKIHRVDPIFAS